MEINLFGFKAEIKKEVVAVILTILVFLAAIAGYLIKKSNMDIIIDSQSSEAISALEKTAVTGEESDNLGTEPAGAEKPAADEIKIYVVGCVKNPGIVTIQKGQLIDDAIRLAGGLTAEADASSINMVYKLEENLMLIIKSKKEILQSQQSGSGGSGDAGTGVKIIKDSGSAVINSSQVNSASKGKVNINRATAGELDTLPGIGEATAMDIISYREENGVFKTIQDIMKVPRIKESRFARIKDFITVN